MRTITKTPTPHAQIAKAVGSVLPKGQPFKVQIRKSLLGGLEVVRVVTPAWKRLRTTERILRVRKAVDQTLSGKELGKILWLSVLTPDEYRRAVGTPRLGVMAEAPAKKKSAKLPTTKPTSPVQKDSGSKAAKRR